MKAVSKPVGGYEVYQTDNMVCVGYTCGGVGSVFGSRKYSTTSNATKAYNKLNDRRKVLVFTANNPAG
jgi:hypothetical protein